MIEPSHLRHEVIRPALEAIQLYSFEAEQLLMGTCATESQMGRYLYQLGEGPALGIFQMEPATHEDIWRSFLSFRPRLAARLATMMAPGDHLGQLTWNLRYSAAMARLKYRQAWPGLPPGDDVWAMGHYYKLWYNSVLGKGSTTKFVADWNTYVEGAEA